MQRTLFMHKITEGDSRHNSNLDHLHINNQPQSCSYACWWQCAWYVWALVMHTGIVRNMEQGQGYVARTEAEGPSPFIGWCASRAASSRGGQMSNAKP